jgi:hypothetical protein
MREHRLRRRQSDAGAGDRFGSCERGLRQLQIGLPDKAPDTSLSVSSDTAPEA